MTTSVFFKRLLFKTKCTHKARREKSMYHTSRYFFFFLNNLKIFLLFFLIFHLSQIMKSTYSGLKSDNMSVFFLMPVSVYKNQTRYVILNIWLTNTRKSFSILRLLTNTCLCQLNFKIKINYI